MKSVLDIQSNKVHWLIEKYLLSSAQVLDVKNKMKMKSGKTGVMLGHQRSGTVPSSISSLLHKQIVQIVATSST